MDEDSDHATAKCIRRQAPDRRVHCPAAGIAVPSWGYRLDGVFSIGTKVPERPAALCRIQGNKSVYHEYSTRSPTRIEMSAGRTCGPHDDLAPPILPPAVPHNSISPHPTERRIGHRGLYHCTSRKTTIASLPILSELGMNRIPHVEEFLPPTRHVEHTIRVRTYPAT
jgi:hypothetical protein